MQEGFLEAIATLSLPCGALPILIQEHERRDRTQEHADGVGVVEPREFREPGFDICLRNYLGSLAENRKDLRRRRIRAQTVQKHIKIMAREIP